jgi:hypothetical protein
MRGAEYKNENQPQLFRFPLDAFVMAVLLSFLKREAL